MSKSEDANISVACLLCKKQIEYPSLICHKPPYSEPLCIDCSVKHTIIVQNVDPDDILSQAPELLRYYPPVE